MIRLRRPTKVPSEVKNALAKPLKNGLTEDADARAYYQKKPRPTVAYDFARYKEIDVCIWLDRLSHEKCAYCESIYRAVTTGDVEHFRPKGGVTGSNPPHPGYWWLAATWTNLLPSCEFCNQTRYHFHFSAEMTLEEMERLRLKDARAAKRSGVSSGKANAFPVHPPSKWVRSKRGDIASEDPLLINPFEKDPSRHLEWVFNWDRKSSQLWTADLLFIAVKPKTRKGAVDPYGLASIGIFGLNRMGLALERIAHAKNLQRAAVIVVRSVLSLSKARSVRRISELQHQLDDDWQYLKDFGAANQRFSAMSKAFIKLFDSELSTYLGS